MKKVIFIAMLFISAISFSQTQEVFRDFPGDAKAPSKPEWTIPPTEQSIELNKLSADFDAGGELNRCVGCCHIVSRDYSYSCGGIMYVFNCNGSEYWVLYCYGQWYTTPKKGLETPPPPCN